MIEHEGTFPKFQDPPELILELSPIIDEEWEPRIDKKNNLFTGLIIVEVGSLVNRFRRFSNRSHCTGLYL